VQRSWGTIEPAGRDANGGRVGLDRKWFANYALCFDPDHGRQDAGKIRVQCATGIGWGSAVIVVIMQLSVIGMVLQMVMVVARRGSACQRHRT
jgi:hypothetical protein